MTTPTDAIAIIGMAGRFPGAESIDELWRNLVNGVESISRFSSAELAKCGIPEDESARPDYVPCKGVLKDVASFDASFFGYSPREAERMDPQIRLLHECAWEALESAGYPPESSGDPVGLFIGANENEAWLRRVRASGPGDGVDTFLLNYREYVATRVSHALDLKGPSLTLLTACSTSLVAVHLACQALAQDDCRLALAGGVSLSWPHKSGYRYVEGFMQSADGRCRSFDAQASGTVFGDGVGLVTLKRLPDAVADRDPILAVIRASAVNNDGAAKAGFTAPSVDGQARAIRAALAAAQVPPESIGLLEAHGTATPVGDPIELEGLRRAFETDRRQYCALGSIKANIGHVNVAAGAAALIKSVLAVQRGRIPPHPHLGEVNPELRLEASPFFIPRQLRAWPNGSAPRRAGVSAFGFGGTNAHVIVEQPPARHRPGPGPAGPRPRQLMMLSAMGIDALDEAGDRLARSLRRRELPLADVAYTLQVGRRHFEHRRYVVCRDHDDLLRQLATDAGRSRRSDGRASPDPRLAFLFPGQGAQYPGMAARLYRHEPEFQRPLDDCLDLIGSRLGPDLREILLAAPETTDREESSSEESSSEESTLAEEVLRETRNAQPAIFAVSYALARMWMAWGVRPQAVLGHSVGEYAAACIAGVLTLEDALTLVIYRAEQVQALPPGKMVAVTMAAEDLVRQLPEELDVAAINAPSLSVVSGPVDAVERFCRQLEEQGAHCPLGGSKGGRHWRELAASHAFHSQQMDALIPRLRDQLATIRLRRPRIPIASPGSGGWVSDEITQPDYWLRNLRDTVDFSAGLRALFERGFETFLEAGPGNTLTTLVRNHRSPRQTRLAVPSLRPPRRHRTEHDNVLNALGRLWTVGVQVDGSAFHRHHPAQRVHLPTYPFQRQRFWLESSAPTEPIRDWHQLVKGESIDRWFYAPTWQRVDLPEPVEEPEGQEENGLEETGPWLFFVDSGSRGDELVELLSERGVRGVVVVPSTRFKQLMEDRYALAPGQPAGFEALFAALEDCGCLPRRIVYAWTLPPHTEEDHAQDEAAIQERGLFGLLHLAQAIGKAKLTESIRIAVVSSQVHEVTGDELLDPDRATLLGPVKVISQEYANVLCQNIDLPALSPRGDQGRETLETKSEGLGRWWPRVALELEAPAPELIVAYRGAYRWVQSYRLAPVPPARNGWRPRRGGTFLITGGLGGLGLVMARWLARHGAGHLVLTSRQPLPARVDWDAWIAERGEDETTSRRLLALREIEALGARAHPAAVDVADEAAMRSLLRGLEPEIGPVRGVLHAAGLPGDGIIQLKRREQVRQVLRPKVLGSRVLHRLFAGTELDFFVLFSSIASVLGGIGLVDYCAANSFLDAFASYLRRREGWRAIAVNWDMWGEVGMGLKTYMPEELRWWLEKELRDGIRSDEGTEVFRRIMSSSPGPQVVVSTRDLMARIDLWVTQAVVPEHEQSPDQELASPRYRRPELSQDFAAPETETEARIAETWGALFGLEKIGRLDNFYELGGHSLLAASMLNRLKRDFDVPLSIRDVLDHPSVAELAHQILDRRSADR